MTYTVKEIFYTLQGEGANTGRPAVFCRFAGCNLWSGKESDRDKAICKFCDTDFIWDSAVDIGKFSSSEYLAQVVADLWPQNELGVPLVVCTGGEPLLQLDAELINAFHLKGFEVAVETNGTLKAPKGIDWVCVSPKADTTLVITEGEELKLVYPQEGAHPDSYKNYAFDNFYLQPMDGIDRKKNTQLAIEYCKANPNWRLSVQVHKIIGIR
jgi:7-carboxy-7-deazaguanine synthase (Cx14CxxC type)